ncbi:MAG: peptidylprolyl isomerase [Flavobacterium sp.]|nr:peptidylprolyl isomerase [Flavobacterium sp.]MBP8157456.1 peptidylprolyl isomerase [Flavobacterium sp.]
MNKKVSFLLIVFTLLLTSCKDDHKNLKDGLYAKIETPKGTILLELEYKKVPITVANFVTLAEGNNQFVMDDLKGKPYFDGIVFHRVDKGFVIQGGDPMGNGTGDPGYVFRDEFTTLKHDKVGTLSMANSGPNTNGSQFFITFGPTPNLDGRHTVFGYVIEGIDIVDAIEVNDEMTNVTIIRKGEDVKKFDAVKVFNDYFQSEIANEKQQALADAESKKIYDEKFKAIKEQKIINFNDLKKTATKTSSGLKYTITRKTSGPKPKDGQVLYINYAGYLEDGTLFDTSNPEIAKQFGKFDQQRALQKGYANLPFKVNGHNQLIPGFLEGVEKMKVGEKAIIFIPSNLAYGEQGAGDAVPPNANIIFELELLDK